MESLGKTRRWVNTSALTLIPNFLFDAGLREAGSAVLETRDGDPRDVSIIIPVESASETSSIE